MIEFDDVSKQYPDGTVAVRGFSATVSPHCTMALVGSSGSGKTTLLRMVNRMVEPTTGRVTIDGQDVATMDKVKLRRSIGYVQQAGGLLPHRTVADNVATVPVLNGEPRKQARAAAIGLLERVGLDSSLATRYPAQLSGGQQQRVAVARALAADPNILLMDEPFGAVDPIVRRELQDELLRLQRDLGKTVILVTHDMSEAFRLADMVAVLKRGAELVQLGTPAEIREAPADDFVASFIGLDEPDGAAAATRTADRGAPARRGAAAQAETGTAPHERAAQGEPPSEAAPLGALVRGSRGGKAGR